MQAVVDKSGCISCGMCVDICPDLFYIGDDGLADVKTEEIPSAMEEEANEAAEQCPVSVIKVD